MEVSFYYCNLKNLFFLEWIDLKRVCQSLLPLTHIEMSQWLYSFFFLKKKLEEVTHMFLARLDLSTLKPY